LISERSQKYIHALAESAFNELYMGHKERVALGARVSIHFTSELSPLVNVQKRIYNTL
jgi:hypothetical protein